MDVDKVEYRIDANGELRVVGVYELIRWDWQHDLEDIPERLVPYEGKLALLRRISGSIAAGQGSSFQTFFVWHRPDLFELVVCQLEDWAGGSRKALGLGREAFADLIWGLPGWDGGQKTPPAASCPLQVSGKSRYEGSKLGGTALRAGRVGEHQTCSSFRCLREIVVLPNPAVCGEGVIVPGIRHVVITGISPVLIQERNRFGMAT